MKRVKKKHVIVTFLIAFVVLGVILSVQLTTLSVYGKHGTDTYAVENSTVESKEFMGGSFNNYAFYYQLSTDIDRDNEIQIFAISAIIFIFTPCKIPSLSISVTIILSIL